MDSIKTGLNGKALCCMEVKDGKEFVMEIVGTGFHYLLRYKVYNGGNFFHYGTDKDVNEVFTLGDISSDKYSFTFYGASCAEDFFMKNYEFFKKCGLASLARYMKPAIDIQEVIVLYMVLITKYPLVPSLINAGYLSLVSSIICGDAKPCELSKVFYSGQLYNGIAFSLPLYVTEYLRKNDATVREYIFWCDVFDKEELSREDFLDYVKSPEATLIRSGIVLSREDLRYRYEGGFDCLKISRILGHGYKFRKTMKYCVKNFIWLQKTFKDDGTNKKHGIQYVFNILGEVLDMADGLDMHIKRYPSSLFGLHGRLEALLQEKRKNLNDFQ